MTKLPMLLTFMFMMLVGLVSSASAQPGHLQPLTGIAPPPPGFELIQYSGTFSSTPSDYSYDDARSDVYAQMSQWYYEIKDNHYYPAYPYYDQGIQSGTHMWNDTQNGILHYSTGTLWIWWYRPISPTPTP